MFGAVDADITGELHDAAVTTSEKESVPVIVVTESPFSVTAVTLIT
jgi:hypothetical protein